MTSLFANINDDDYATPPHARRRYERGAARAPLGSARAAARGGEEMLERARGARHHHGVAMR